MRKKVYLSISIAILFSLSAVHGTFATEYSFESKQNRNNNHEDPEYVWDFFWIAHFEGELEYYKKFDKITLCYPVNVTFHGIFWYYDEDSMYSDLWYSNMRIGNWHEHSEFGFRWFIGRLTQNYIKGIAIPGHVSWIN